MLATGRFEEARDVLLRAHDISLDAEPQVSGLMRALAAVAHLRLGQDELALAELEEGVAGSRQHPAALPLFASLGVLAEPN